ncbi:hypothetical protein QJQ45_028428, partial [Haematococcus lacustris]
LVKAMVDKKRGVKANCANVQKAREVTAQRRAAEAAGPIEIGAQAGVIAAEAQAQADAGADEADVQLHQLQADLQHRELQLAHNQRMQQLQQQLQDLQRSELQRKEQQLADLVAQQGAALLQWEHQLTERQHQLICRLSATRGAAAAGSPHAAAADRPATKQTAGGEAAFGLFAGYQQQPPPPRPFSMLSHKVGKPTSRDMAGNYREESVFVSADKCDQSVEASTTAIVQVIECLLQGRRHPEGILGVASNPDGPMPMFQDTVKEVSADEECYALLMLFHPNLLHDEVCFGKLTNKHCERYRMHMGWKRQEGRQLLRRLVLRELQSEQLEAEYEADN